MNPETLTKKPLFPSDDARPYLRRVQVRNYKSIGQCSVDLGSLTILVGRNGAGKSNFLDALRFVVDGLQTTLGHAIRSRGGLDSVRRKSGGRPRNFAIQLEWDLPEFTRATYKFEIAARPHGAYTVQQEELEIVNLAGEDVAHYSVQEGKVVRERPKKLPVATADRLYLVAASSLPAFRPAYDALTSVGFYNLNPDAMKELQSPDAGEMLLRDGSNIASVIERLSTDKHASVQRIMEYLERIVPGVKKFARVTLGPSETLEFQQDITGTKTPRRFYALSMSDGTLRVVGALTAVMQLANRTRPVSLVGIEEPETALHPGAAGVLMDALREGATRTQVLVTTHSPDLLDQFDVATDSLLVVEAKAGTTRIARPEAASLQAIKDHLYTPGELLRMDQLQPDEEKVSKPDEQITFRFSEGEDEQR